jgi:hypothetical protein
VLWVNTCAEKSSSDDSPIYTVTYAVVHHYSSSLSTMRSQGHCHLSLRLMCSGLINSVTWLFSYCISRLWYMVEYFISSVTNGIWRSLCSVRFETYHGALVMERSMFDWNRWSTFMFDGLIHPQSWIPYVQIGFGIHLYTRILISSESLDFHLRSQDICYTFKFRCWRFVLMFFCQVSFWSR